MSKRDYLFILFPTRNKEEIIDIMLKSNINVSFLNYEQGDQTLIRVLGIPKDITFLINHLTKIQFSEKPFPLLKFDSFGAV